jgi:hypothetical protein
VPYSDKRLSLASSRRRGRCNAIVYNELLMRVFEREDMEIFPG